MAKIIRGGRDRFNVRTGRRKDPPRTRQSLLILAAFRPWGGSQDGRRTGGRRPSLRLPPMRGGYGRWSGRPVSSSAEDSPSGLGRTIGNRVGLTPSGVQIPYPPPCRESRHLSHLSRVIGLTAEFRAIGLGLFVCCASKSCRD